MDDHQAELLKLLDQLDDVEADKKQAMDDFKSTIKQLKNQIRDERRELKSKSKSQSN